LEDRQVARNIYEKANYNYDVQVPFLSTTEVEVPTLEFEETTNYRPELRKTITQNTFSHKHHYPHSEHH